MTAALSCYFTQGNCPLYSVARQALHWLLGCCAGVQPGLVHCIQQHCDCCQMLMVQQCASGGVWHTHMDWLEHASLPVCHHGSQPEHVGSQPRCACAFTTHRKRLARFNHIAPFLSNKTAGRLLGHMRSHNCLCSGLAAVSSAARPLADACGHPARPLTLTLHPSCS